MARLPRDASHLRAVRAACARFGLFVLLAAAGWTPAQAQVCNAPNLARSGVASAPSTYPGYSTSRVNDGDRSTNLGGGFSWVNDRGMAAQLDLTLPAPARIDRVQLFTTRGYEAHSYDLQLRVAGTWVTVQSVRGNTAVVRDHRFAARLADAVRLVGIVGSAQQAGYFRVNELEIYACQSSPQATALRGRVVRFADHAGLANVAVNIGGGFVTTTDAGGNYAFAGLPPGLYTVRPSLAGWTFGSDQFLIDRFTAQAAGGTLFLDDLVGYDRNPIVYVTGLNANRFSFDPVYDELPRHGYASYDADILTEQAYTPPFAINALRVRDRIDVARYETGQPRVILFGYSMGGLVSRTYVESFLYRNDVSQLFTFGSPHRGAPLITQLACVPQQPAVCEMSKPGMLLFNLTHGQRPGVAYHVIGGDAPMWRQQQICFRIFGHRICIRSIPIPSFEFRNAAGWAMGIIVPEADDGLIQTYSSTGMPGFLDRMTTQEVHTQPGLGRRGYFEWENVGLSGQAYQNCVLPVLVTRARSTCGVVSPQLPFGRVAQPRRPYRAMTTAEQPGFERRSRDVRTTLSAGQRIEREVLVDDGPTLFTARWAEGSARVTLIDPSGQVFDPEFAGSILDGEPAPGEPVGDALDPSMVLYTGDGSSAGYQFPAPRPGRWRVIVEGGSDIPAAGTPLETVAAFASDLDVTFANDFPFHVPGTDAEFVLSPTSALFSAEARLDIRTLDGKVDTVPMLRQGDGSFRGTYRVAGVPGIAEISWTVTGVTATGQAFERGGSDAVQIGRQTLVVTKVGTEVAVPAGADQPSKRYLALDVPVAVRADYAGRAMLSADLVDGNGDVVAHAAQMQDVGVGDNDVRLRFAGDDIFANGRDGPYRLTNLITTDQREAPLLSDWLLDQLVTAAYDHRLFGDAAPPGCEDRRCEME